MTTAFPVLGSGATAFACPLYTPHDGSKRCRDYRDNGSCSRPEVGSCVEWLRRNGQPPLASSAPPGAPVTASSPSSRPEPGAPPSSRRTTPPRPEPSPRDLFGERDLFGAPIAPRAHRPKPPRTLAPAAAPARAPSAPAVTPAHIASFRELHAEVCFVSPELGEVWLVAARTGQDRQEVTIEDVALLANISTAFPGSRVVELRKRLIGAVATGGDALVSLRPGGTL